MRINDQTHRSELLKFSLKKTNPIELAVYVDSEKGIGKLVSLDASFSPIVSVPSQPLLVDTLKRRLEDMYLRLSASALQLNTRGLMSSAIKVVTAVMINALLTFPIRIACACDSSYSNTLF